MSFENRIIGICKNCVHYWNNGKEEACDIHGWDLNRQKCPDFSDHYKPINQARQKIYVITAGEYSDYHICAVTTDPERAEQLRRHYYDEGYNGAEIEEFIDGDPDAGVCVDLRPIWNVWREVRNVWHACIEEYINMPFQNEFELTDPKYICSNTSTAFRAKVDVEDKEHALKIAQDKFAKMMAEELGL